MFHIIRIYIIQSSYLNLFIKIKVFPARVLHWEKHFKQKVIRIKFEEINKVTTSSLFFDVIKIQLIQK